MTKRGATKVTADASASQLIDAKIASLGDWRGETLARLRKLIREACPDIVETMKWQKPSNPAGVPVWEHGGIVCTGETYKDKVKLTFAKGASLPDPSGLFNASLDGNMRRAIDIIEGAPIDADAFKALVRSAAALNEGKGAATPSARSDRKRKSAKNETSLGPVITPIFGYHAGDFTGGTIVDQRTLPPPRLAPLPPEATPELKPQFDATEKRMGFVPNSMLIMQRDPKLTQGYAALSSAVWRADSRVDLKLKRLISHVASRSAGCKYCMAHTAEGSAKLGVEQKKLDEVWSYQTSPLYSPAERAALDVAVAAGCVPNAVTEEMFAELRKHWDDEQVVEIVGVIALFGFLNRWNDTFATPLEDEPLHFGETHLAKEGWDPGKHLR
jgi:uncharacterized peroxidase-related enzyme